MNSFLSIGFFLYFCMSIFAGFKIRQYMLLKRKKEICRSALRVVKSLNVKRISFELYCVKSSYTILFHGCDEKYLRKCLQTVRWAIPYTKKSTQVQLMLLARMIERYVRSNMQKTGDVKLLWMRYSCKKVLLNPYDVALARKRHDLKYACGADSPKRFYKHCRTYLNNQASIHTYFSTLLSMLHAELSHCV